MPQGRSVNSLRRLTGQNPHIDSQSASEKMANSVPDAGPAAQLEPQSAGQLPAAKQFRWSRLPTAVLFDDRLTAEKVRVLAVLGLYADRGGVCFPHIEDIAVPLQRTARTIQRHLRTLGPTGYVLTTRQNRLTGGFMRNRFQTLYRKLRVSANSKRFKATSNLGPAEGRAESGGVGSMNIKRRAPSTEGADMAPARTKVHLAVMVKTGPLAVFSTGGPGK